MKTENYCLLFQLLAEEAKREESSAAINYVLDIMFAESIYYICVV